MKLGKAISCTVLIVASGWAGSVAAEDSESLLCRSGVAVNFAKTDDTIIYSVDHRGIVLAQDPAKTFDNFTHHCVGSIAVIRGARSGEGFCRYVDPASGDARLAAWTERTQPLGGTYTYIGGTGRWKGISGGGEYQLAAPTRPVTEGTYQNCIRTKGTFTLPKP